MLDETIANSSSAIGKNLFIKGRAVPPWTLITTNVTRSNFDRFAQEDAVLLSWKNQGEAAFTGPQSDASFLAQPDAGFVFSVRIDKAPLGPVMLMTKSADGNKLGAVDIGGKLRALSLGEWGNLSVPLKCISSDSTKWASIITPLSIKANSPLTLGLSEITIKGLPEPDQVCNK